MTRSLIDDLRFALRRLRQQPGFAAVAVLTLALGLGANTAIFTLVRGLMFRHLPVERPGELYRLGDDDNCCVNSGLQGSYSLFSFPLYVHLRDHADEFVSLAGFQARTSPIGVRRLGAEFGESYPSKFVSGNYFTTFGVRAAAGRLLTPADDRPDAPPALVMSYDAWTRTFDRDPSTVGATFIVNGKPMTLVGVTAPGFFGDTILPRPAAFWIPLGQEPVINGAQSLITQPAQDWLYAIGRLKPGAAPDSAAAHLSLELEHWLAAQSFVSDRDRATLGQQRIVVVSAAGGVELMRLTFGSSLTLLAVTSAFVLFIATANLANLLLARADRGQAAIRSALGGSTLRLMRQTVTEGVLLALMGGLAGLVVANLGARAMLALAFPGGVARPIAAPETTVWVFAFALSIVTGVLCTAAPAWAMSRTPPIDALRGVGRSGSDRAFVPRRSLAIVQVVLSVVLLSSAGLLGRSLGRLETQPLGFDPVDRLSVKFDPPPMQGAVDRLSAFYAASVHELRRVPGIQQVSYALYSPMEGNNWSSRISIQGRASDPDRPDGSSWNRVGPDYFDTMGTRVVHGRPIDARDTPGGAPVAVVNQTFVQQFLPDADPIGRRVGIGDQAHAGDFEIVGVTEDVKYTGSERPTRPMIFLPAFQTVSYDSPSQQVVQARSLQLGSLVIRTAPGAAGLEGAIRRALARVDPDATVTRVTTFEQQVAGNFGQSRMMARITGAYGLLALGLASLGLYRHHGLRRRPPPSRDRRAHGARRRPRTHRPDGAAGTDRADGRRPDDRTAAGAAGRPGDVGAVVRRHRRRPAHPGRGGHRASRERHDRGPAARAARGIHRPDAGAAARLAAAWTNRSAGARRALIVAERFEPALEQDAIGGGLIGLALAAREFLGRRIDLGRGPLDRLDEAFTARVRAMVGRARADEGVRLRALGGACAAELFREIRRLLRARPLLARLRVVPRVVAGGCRGPGGGPERQNGGRPSAALPPAGQRAQ